MKKNITFITVYAFIILSFSNCGYNKMVDMREGVESQWGNVENVYQRRADLIPNLVSTVKGYAKHEKETLEGVINARAKATSVNVDPKNITPQMLQQFQSAQSGLAQALSKLMVVVERYPDLKANENFKDLQVQLEGTENRIATERRKFNETVRGYNAYIKQFPQIIYSGWFGFDKKVYFQGDERSREVPNVEF